SEVTARSESAVREERLTSRLGCRSVSELVQRTTRLGPHTVGRLERAARATRQGRSVFSGEHEPAALPAMRAALLDGEVGLDGVLAVAEPLSSLASGVSREALLVADQVLAAEARGEGPDGAPPLCADLLKVQARVWAVVLDQDGAEPRERQALLKRGLTLGPARDGLVAIQGRLLPEVAAQLQRIFDASLSPKVAGDGVRFVEAEASDPSVPFDDRRRPQQQHDAFAGALAAAAVSGELPTIGGAAPTLVVSVRSEDLESGRGWAHTEGTDEPLALAAARHVGCAGVVQRVVLGDNGRILRLGTEERVFNRYQRRAIALRDGGCIIPGCGVPAGWCEIHHVTGHAEGGPTHTDNGVLLCWYHHRFVDRNGWSIRMNRDVPEVRAPSWIDARMLWRPVTRSPTRLRDRVVRQT
ncbi:MAG: DUF222 domain-containing protein, partial [Microbacterium sp.]|uniref:HNH endonuclease signature motif containing protein n=1 Tax=Microbacterium sp. TaxID=51671 RepID=UPI0027237DD7